MLKRSSEYLLLLCLAGCASTAPQQQVPTPEPPASDAVMVAAAPTPGPAGSAATAKPLTPPLALSLQKKMDEASERLMAGQKDKALALYAEVQQAAPAHVSAWLNAALIKREQKDLSAALELIEQSLQQVPNEARSLTLKGVVLREQGKLQDAKAAYLAAVAADEAYAPAHRNLAVLADVYLDEPVLALQHMERYAALVGDDKQVNGWVTELRRRAQTKASGGP